MKAKEYQKQYYLDNRIRLNASNKAYREAHKDKIHAYLDEWRREHPDWMKQYRQANREKIRAWSKRNHEKHRLEHNSRRKAVAEQLRQKFLVQFGEPKVGHKCGVCPCCGEDLLHFGTIHHINGDGKEHRQSKCHHGMLREAIASNDKSRFIALCFNCNLAAERNGGHCPGHSDMEGHSCQSP